MAMDTATVLVLVTAMVTTTMDTAIVRSTEDPSFRVRVNIKVRAKVRVRVRVKVSG